MRRTLTVLVAAILTASAQAQTAVVRFVWTHEQPEITVTADFERNGIIAPCGPVTIAGADKQCSATVPIGVATFRLRQRNAQTSEISEWSSSVTATVGDPPQQQNPGPFTITGLFETPAPPPDPGPPPLQPPYADLFDVDTSGDWIDDTEGRSPYTRDATNGELDTRLWGVDARLRYRLTLTTSSDPPTPGTLDQEVQATALTHATGRAIYGGCRMSGPANDAYGLHLYGGIISLSRFRAGVRTSLRDIGQAFTSGNFVTVRMRCTGGNGAPVVIALWRLQHGTQKPIDPQWIKETAAPDWTYIDNGSTRLDDQTLHLGIGLAGRNVSGSHDPRLDYWRARIAQP